MRSLLNTAAVVAAIALVGCPDKRPQPVPGPQSAPERSRPAAGDAHASGTRAAAGASEISWFQGTLEEAFSRRTCNQHRTWSLY